jgi:hypothetical protein
LLVVSGYPFLIGYAIKAGPADEVTFALIGGLIFFCCYLLPLGALQAKIELEDDGVVVHRWNTTLLEYTEMSRCYGFFLFPFQIVILVTKRRFPLKIIISGDSIQGRRTSIWQAGIIAQTIQQRIAVEAR